MAEKVLAAVVQEALCTASRPARVDGLAQAMDRHLREPGFVIVCAEIDDKITALLTRPLEDHWPRPSLEQGRIVSVAVIVTVAVSRREVLGLAIGPSEGGDLSGPGTNETPIVVA